SNATAPAAPSVPIKGNTALWRSSKLIGVDVYNEANEKLGDITEVILDPAGKVAGYVVGIDGGLGMGEGDILVATAKIKFVNEPAKSAGIISGAARSESARWYPHHAVLNATKDQLKAMPQFNYMAYD